MLGIDRDQFAFFGVILHDLPHGFGGQHECRIASLLAEGVLADMQDGPFDRHAVFIADHARRFRG